MNRALLKTKGYPFLISSQIISNLGDWFHILALMALIGLKWDASPFAISIAMFCIAVPGIFLGSFAGVLSDRFDRKQLMILADGVRAIAVIGIVFATNIWMVYLLLIIMSSFSALFQPSKEGKLREIVDEDLLQSAVATSELINNGAKIVGPILSGIFVAFVGIEWSFYLDSASFILSALILIGVPKTDRSTSDDSQTSEKTSSSFLGQFMDGLAFMKKKPKILYGLIVFSIMMFALQICDSQIVVLLRLLPEDPTALMGWMMAGSGLGVVVASLILNVKEVKSNLLTLILASVALGIGYIFCATFIHLPVFWINIIYPIAGVIFGFCFGLGVIPFNVMAQKLTPSEYTGRVFGTIGSMTTFAVVMGMILGGVISELFGVITTYIFSGALLVLVGIIVYSIRRRIEGEEENAESYEGALRKAQV